MEQPKQENYINRRAGATGMPVTPIVDDSGLLAGSGNGTPGVYKEKSLEGAMALQDRLRGMMSTAKAASPDVVSSISAGSIYSGNRYERTMPGTDYEEMAANQQSTASKWGNGVAKMAGTAGSSFISGTAGLVYGIGAAMNQQRLAALIDNDVTRSMDDSMKKFEDYAPNYYTKKETDASWYSPDNILTANFWSDKVIKNLGFSVGAIAGGVAWAGLFRQIGAINKLVQMGEGLSAATATEQAMAAVPKLGKYAAFDNTITKLTQTLIKTPASKLLQNSDRILTSAMGTFGEASIEGLQGLNQYRENAIEEYRKIHGYAPEGAELDAINKEADRVGLYIWGANTLILTGTNYIQLPKILGSSRKVDKALINNIRQESVGGIFTTSLPKSALGRITKGASSVVGHMFAPTEALEEGLQYATQVGVTDYFERARHNKEATKGFLNTLSGTMGNILTEGIAETLTSKEGMESMLIGALSGGIQQSGIIGTYKNSEGKTRVGIGKSGTIGERGVFGYGGEKADNTSEALTKINKTRLDGALKDAVKFMGIGIGSQQLRQQAIENDDILAEKNYENDFAVSYIMPRVKYGKEESIKMELNAYRDQSLSTEGFRELVNDGIINEKETREQFLARLDDIQNLTNNITKRYEQINDKYEAKVNNKGERIYSDDIIDRLVYASAKVLNYDKRIPEVNTSLIQSGIDTQSIVSEIINEGITTLVESEQYNKAVADINSKDINRTDKEELIQDLDDLIELSVQRKSYIEQYNEILNKPENFVGTVEDDTENVPPLVDEDGNQLPEDHPEVIAQKQLLLGSGTDKVATVTIPTAKGDVAVELGTEYFVGKITGKSKEGKDYYRALKLKVLGENEDGTIKIQWVTSGEIKDISKEELMDYNLGKVSSTLTNKKAMFYMTNWNTIYQHFGIKKKDGTPVQGRLTYNDKDKILNFVYVNDKGATKSIEVKNTAFATQKGYKHPMLKALYALTYEQQKAEDEFVNTPDDRTDEIISKRLDILGKLSSELTERTSKLENQIEKGKNKVQRMSEQIDSLKETIEQEDALDKRAKKNLRFKGAARNAIADVMALSREVEQLKLTIEELEAERQDLEANIAYIDDFSGTLDEMPNDIEEFMTKLRYERLLLWDSMNSTIKQINLLQRLIKALEDTLASAVALLNDLINKFETKFPKAPLSLGQPWVDFLQANPNFLKNKPTYKEDLRMVEDMIQQVEDVEIAPGEKRLNDLKEHLDLAVDSYKDMEAELKNRNVIIARFAEIIDEYNKREKAKKRYAANTVLADQLIGTNTKELQNKSDTNAYEPDSKKDKLKVVKSTIAPSAKSENGKLPHHLRANRFGTRFHNLEKSGKKIRGIVVTQKTEGQIGLDGLMVKLKGASNVDPADTIALVMVEVYPDGSYFLVDEFGEPLAKGDNLDSAIYQTFPASKLTATYNGKVDTMFRGDVPEWEQTQLNKKYTAWRNAKLGGDTLGQPESITASFGIARYIETLAPDGKIINDYETPTSAEAAELVTPAALSSTPVIDIAKNNDSISNGSVTFRTPLGRVFLNVPGGLVKLFNRKFNNTEANVIFDVIKQLATNVDRDGVISSDSNDLLDWLKSVVYWGIAKTGEEGKKKTRKDPGYNNIWFESTNIVGVGKTTRLFLSGLDANFEFTPEALEANKELIVMMIERMHGNTSSSLTNNNKFNNPYAQIIGIDKYGKPIYKNWKNYQTFLLSSEGRKVSEIPLTTRVRPIDKADPESVNREGIYFTLNNTSDDFDVIAPTAPRAVVVATPVVQTPAQQQGAAPVKPQAPVQPTVVTVQPVAGAPKQYTKDKTNVETLGAFGDFPFNIAGGEIIKILNNAKTNPLTDPSVMAEFLGYILDKNIFVVSDINPTQLAAVKQARGYTDDEGSTGDEKALNLINTSIITRVLPKIVAENMPEQPPLPTQPTPSPVAQAATPVAAVPTPVVEQQEDAVVMNKAEGETHSFTETDDTAYRQRLVEEAESFMEEDWGALEGWLSKNFPNIPVYRVKNVIRNTNGKQIWGMFQDGAIYVYENAEVGTIYHEVFEAVWSIHTDSKERKDILKEFRNREGSYQDRFTGKVTEYANATDHDIKEEIAEEFRDYVLTGQIPDRTQSQSLIGKLFKDIVNWIKTFFTGKDALSNTQALFSQIGNGYYKQFNPYESKLNYAKSGVIDIEDVTVSEDAQARAVPIPFAQMNDIIQQMTFKTLTDIVNKNDDLFAIEGLNKDELYAGLQADILNRLEKQLFLLDDAIGKMQTKDSKVVAKYNNIKDLKESVIAEWPAIQEKHEQYLRTFSIEFDENDEVALKDEDNSGKELYNNATQIDTYRKASAAVKLLTATLAYAENGKIKYSSIGGANLIPADKVFIELMNRLHDSVDIEDMMYRLKDLGIENPNYAPMVKRLTGYAPTEITNFDKLNNNSFKLMSSFWRTMKKQNADAITVFILSNGETVVSDTTLNSTAKQAKKELSNDMISAFKNDKSPFISYKNGVFNPTPAVSSYKLDSSNPKTYIGFLANLGITFTEQELSKEKLTDNQLKAFMKAVDGIRKSISEVENLSAVSTYTLDIDGNMLALATIKAVIEHPDFDSTYYNISGERTQTFIGTNALSDLYHVMLSVNNIQDLQNTNYAFLLTDAFSEGNSSALLSKMFNIGPGGDGSRIYGSEKLLKPSYVDGTINEGKNKKKQSSKLTYKERIIQEMNLNINGVFHNLIPGDATIEWAVNMYNKDAPFVNTAIYKTGEYREFFKRYFISEVNLSRANRPIVGSKKRSNKDLRFFKAILADNNADEDKVNSLHDKIIKASEKNITPEGLYNDFQGEINKALDRFIERETKDTLDMLYDNSIVTTTEKGLELEGINFNDRGEVLTEESLKDNVRLISINYIMANIELHKLIYSDPYQYSDELKRIKNFNSPRQPMMVGSSDSSKNKIDRVLDEISNKLYKAQNDIARADMFRNYFNAVTLDDVISAEDLEGYNVIEDQNIDNSWEETDGGGYIMLKAIRTFRKRVGTWNDSNERQYVYDMVYEKIIKGDGKNEEERAKLGLTISKEEKEIYLAGNPMVKSTYTPEKPIVSGSKLSERGYNDIVLDKYALNVLSFRLLHEMNPSSNAVKLYNKMQKEDIDYAVYNTGRKVGTEITHPIYDENGKFNNTPFTTKEQLNNKMLPQGIVKIPFNIMSVQSEVPSKDTPQVTQGSQITKLATLDFLEAGVPIDFEYKVDGVIVEDFDDRYVAWIKMSDEERKSKSVLYKEIINNNEILAARIELGYETLLTKLGIEKTDLGFVMKKPDVLVKTLTDEILSREVNENIISAFNGYKKGEVILEATPAYKQIRNILYALADKNVISPKISGGMKVQIPATMLESNQIVKHKYVVKGETKVIYKSGELKFYENADGKRVCEIMVARWFKSDKTDEELLESWYDKDGNITDEGKKVLSGIGFRIPTQKQNSIDAFVIKKFLPYELGDSVVIPSALVKKAGSDFDIDKLSIYLKNVFTDSKGQPQAVPYYGIGKAAIDKFRVLYEDGEFNEYIKGLKDSLPLDSAEDRLIASIFQEEASIQKKDVINTLYKKSLENAYITSLENLVSHPANFDNLIKPNSADQLKSLSKKIYGKLGNKQTDYGSTGNMLNRRFMSGLRQAFVNGKYAIGIAAIAQTNHSQNQRSPIYIDTDRLGTEAISAIDRAWLGDGELKFAKYNSMFINGKDRATFSKVKNAKGEYISDIIGQFIDGYVDISKGPWIMEMGATPNIASTWLLLIKLGVPINDVAYFMNQPIIRDYIKEIQSNGYSYLFIDKYSTAINEKYNPGKGYSATSTPISSIPNESTLLESIGKDVSKMDKNEKAAQRFMLREFLKYAKMSEHLLHVTQGSNYDTAALNDPFLIFKKEMMLIKARNTIISSVDNLLDNSHVGVIRKTVGNIRDAYATVLLSDRDRNESGGATVRSVLQNVLMPYIDMPDKTFLKVSQKAVSDLFDWAVQNNEGFNEQIKSVLLGSSTAPSAATSVMSFVNSIKMDKDHQLYNNMIIESLRKDSGPIINDIDPTTGELRYGKPDNLYIVSKDNKAYDQDRIINSFREVREYLKGIGRYDIYEKMMAVTVIQSGLSNSILSYTQLLPYEDFKNVYNETLFNLDKLTNLANFYNLDVFQRNNWSNPDIVVGERARLLKSQSDTWYNPNEVFLDKSLKNAYEKDRTLPKMLSFSTQSVAGRSDFVSYTWEEYVGKTKKSILRKKGDRSYIKKGLFKKVYYTNPVTNNFEPLIQVQNYKGKIYNNYVYVAINAWGDSFRANEFYDTAQPSVINNEYIKVVDTFDKANKRLTKGEVTGEEVANVYFKINTHVAIEPIDPLTANFVKEQDNSKTTPPGLPGIDRSPTKCE